MRSKGKIINWNDKKGFGFIESFEGGGKHTFIHRTDIKSLNRPPKVGDIITFSVGKDKGGRVKAVDGIILAAQKRQSKNTIKEYNLVFALLFLAVVVLFYLFNKIPLVLLGIYVFMSFFVYLFYFMDKRAAKRDASRIPEETLLMLGLIGGWPGAIIGQQIHRHKSNKKSFRRLFWLTVLINIGALVFMLYALDKGFYQY